MKKFDVAALGELMVDFVPAGHTKENDPQYVMAPGGAPANVAAGAAKLGARAAFLGKVGADPMGSLLRNVLRACGVDTGGLRSGKGFDTLFSLVELNEAGDRSFRFFGEHRADAGYCPQEVAADVIRESRVLHVGSISMAQEPSRSATLFAVETARENGTLVSFDPNIRPALWSGMEAALSAIRAALPRCDILKVSEEELRLLTGLEKTDAGMKKLEEEDHIPLIFTTLGPKGCQWLFQGRCGGAPTYDVHTVDTTGAGDSFIAAALVRLFGAGREFASLGEGDVAEAADFACAASALTTAGRGGISAMPGAAGVEELRRSGKRIKC